MHVQSNFPKIAIKITRWSQEASYKGSYLHIEGKAVITKSKTWIQEPDNGSVHFNSVIENIKRWLKFALKFRARVVLKICFKFLKINTLKYLLEADQVLLQFSSIVVLRGAHSF